jgi:Glycosyl hydrolase family 26
MRARHFVLLLLVLAVVAVWRPDWRVAAQRAVEPYVARMTASLREQRRASRAGPLPKPSPSPTPGGVTGRSRGGEIEQDEIPPQHRVSSPDILPAGNLPPRLPALRPPPPLPASLRALQAAVRANPSAAGYRQLADAAAAAGYHALAAEGYLEEARLYRRLGDPNAAVVEEWKAGRYRAEGRLYLHAPTSPPPRGPAPAADRSAVESAAPPPPRSGEGEPALQHPSSPARSGEESRQLAGTRQRLEPPYGAYLGAFIDRDDELQNTFMDENWQTHRDPEEFEERVGKQHASYFCYLRYGQRFPFRWAERLRGAGAIPHIAWEPRSLAEVNDDATLSRFVDAVAQFGAPIFIRFAGEMNGDWTPYHDDPALYRQKFRLVHRVLSQRAPNAALIWCVNNVPDAPIDAYYPGDDAVDWVGVNFYNVLYFDNDPTRPADQVHPVDMLQRVYARYAARKPIALCEYAASHRAAVDLRPRPELAVTRLAQLYAALPRLFPRVKLVDWFDCNNLRRARPERQLNDYSITDDPSVLSAYRTAIAPDYFLGQREDRPSATIRPLRDQEPLDGIVTLSAWVRAPLDRPRVYLVADDHVLYAGDEPGAPVCQWDTRRARPGTHAIRLLVVDHQGRRLLEERRTVRTR